MCQVCDKICKKIYATGILPGAAPIEKWKCLSNQQTNTAAMVRNGLGVNYVNCILKVGANVKITSKFVGRSKEAFLCMFLCLQDRKRGYFEIDHANEDDSWEDDSEEDDSEEDDSEEDDQNTEGDGQEEK